MKVDIQRFFFCALFAVILFTAPAFAASDTGFSEYEFPTKNCPSCGVSLEANFEGGKSYPPTCTKEGFAYYVRCACGQRIPGKRLPALGHTPGRTEHQEPSCVFPGYILTFCARCDVCISRVEEGAPIEHSMKPRPNTTTEPGCEEPGSVQMVCTVCAYTTFVDIPPLGGEHIFVEDPQFSQSATCIGEGYTYFACSRCSRERTDWFPSLGHDWTENSRTPATCLTSGSIQYGCSRCSVTKTETIPQLGTSHIWTVSGQTAATCTTPGRTGYTCSRCGEVRQETSPALDHDWQETSRKNATCTVPGSIHYDCSRCDETKIETIPKLAEDHTWTETTRTEPTCTASGAVNYTCSACREAKSEILPALDHDWAQSGHTDPTCTAPGSTSYTCSRCGFSRSENIPALGPGHAWTETSRTETEIHYTCSTCGAAKTAPINAPSDMTMSSLLEKLTAVFTAALDWTGTVAETIAANPMLLLCVVLGFIGTGVLLFKRLLRL